MFTLSRLFTSVLCCLSSCLPLFTATSRKLVYLQDHSVLIWQKCSHLEEVIHYFSNVVLTLSNRIHPGHNTDTHIHMLLCLREQRLEPAGSHNSTEKEEYQTTGSFFYGGRQKHGCHHTAGALWEKNQKISPHWDSTAMWERACSWCRKIKQMEGFWGTEKGKISPCINMEGRDSSKPIFKHSHVIPAQRAC